MNRIILYAFLVLILIGVGLFEYKSKPQMYPPKITSNAVQTTATTKFVNYQAKFLIYTNGIKRDFTASMYHNLSEDVFIERFDPSVVYVKTRGITWGAFFKTLPLSLTTQCLTTGSGETFCTNNEKTLKFYLNGVEDKDVLMKEIHDNDTVLVSYGNESADGISQQLEELK